MKLALAVGVGLAMACGSFAAPVNFDISKSVNKDAIFEAGGAGKAQPLGGNPAAKHTFGEKGLMDGLPSERRVASTDPSLGSYVLLPYAGANVIELKSDATAPGQECLVEVPDQVYQKVGLLVTSVDGDSSFTIKLLYSDGTVDTLWFEADDWYDLGPRGNLKKAVRDMDRVEAATGAAEDSNHFNVYEFIMDAAKGLKTDKVLTSIMIGNTPNRWPDNEARYGVVFAVNGATADAQ